MGASNNAALSHSVLLAAGAFRVGDPVWVQAMHASTGVLHPEYYAARIKHVHADDADGLHDVLFEGTGRTECSVGRARLRPRQRAPADEETEYGGADVEGAISVKSNNTPSSTRPIKKSRPTASTHDKTFVSPQERQKLATQAKSRALNAAFLRAKATTGWGLEWRRKWDASARAAMLEKRALEEILEAEKRRDRQTGRVAGHLTRRRSELLPPTQREVGVIVPQYTYLDGLFAGPPNGDDRRNFFIVPRPHVSRGRADEMSMPSVVSSPALSPNTTNNKTGNGDGSPTGSWIDGASAVLAGSISASAEDGAGGSEGDAGVGAPASFITRLEAEVLQAARPALHAMVPTRSHVGGIPLRCDYASSKLKQRRSPQRPPPRHGERVVRGHYPRLGRSRHVNPPLHDFW